MSTKNTMKHNAVITTMLLLVLFTFSACASVTPDDQTSKDSNITENGASTGCSDYDNTSAPEFFNDLGKTLDELKNEHPEGNVIVRPDGFPDSAAICFGASESEYLYCFFGAQSGDAEKAMNEYEDRVKGFPYVALEPLCHKTVSCSANGSYLLKNGTAFSTIFQRSFQSINLTPDTANPG